MLSFRSFFLLPGRAARRLLGAAKAPPATHIRPVGPLLSPSSCIFGTELAYSIHPTSRFVVHAKSGTQEIPGFITIGRGVYIGKEVELSTYGRLSIGRETSIQDHCILSGDIQVGAYCTFSYFIFVGSMNHRFKDKPGWLIRDQDADAHSPSSAADLTLSLPVMVDEDCWIGWGAVINPGVRIGRGAIIGANCVVTKDVRPYEIHGGVPNRKIGLRLPFSPPPEIDAREDRYLPYFYSGFGCSQKELERSRSVGIIEAGSTCVIVLEKCGAGQAVFYGVCLDRERLVRLKISINGHDCGIHELGFGDFELALPVEGPTNDAGSNMARSFFSEYTYIEVEDIERNPRSETGRADEASRFGFAVVRLNPAVEARPVNDR